MAKEMFYCKKCDSMRWGNRVCPICENVTIRANLTETEWEQKTKEEQKKIKDDLRRMPEDGNLALSQAEIERGNFASLRVIAKEIHFLSIAFKVIIVLAILGALAIACSALM